MINIYKITNLINDKIYIGITKNSIHKRFIAHKVRKNNLPIGNAIRKYGSENFKIECIDTADDLKSALAKETHYISHYNSHIHSGHGYNIIIDSTAGEFTHDMKISLVESIKNSKKYKSCSRYEKSSSYIGVIHNKPTDTWEYCISLDGKKQSQKRFYTEYDAAIARDIVLVNTLPKDDCDRVLNFPEHYENYISNVIGMPDRYLKISSKKSIYNWVQFDKGYWRVRITKKLSVGMFISEMDAAEYADYLSIKNNISKLPLNFPDINYNDVNYTPPKTISRINTKTGHKNISVESEGYRLYIESGGKKFRNYYKSLEKAIMERNKILISIGRKIPD